MTTEIEYGAGQLAECRGTSGNGLRRLGGLAAVFGSKSQLLPGGFHEYVSNRAFAKSESEGWAGVLAKFEHRDVLGTIRGNTLEINVTPRGLDYTVDVVSSTIGDHAYALAQRGDLASSFAFRALEDWFEMGSDGIPVRHLDSVSLSDVSCVSNPAYLDSSCALRSLSRQMQAPYEDVQRYAENGRLAAFFTRSDRTEVRGGSARRRTWRQAMVELEGMRWPEERAKPLTAKQKELELMRMRWPGEHRRRTWRQAQVELMGMVWPEERAKPLTIKQKILETEAMNPLWLE